MDYEEFVAPIADDYEPGARLPLLTLSEARDVVAFLQLLESLDVSSEGEAAGHLAGDLAMRIPAD